MLLQILSNYTVQWHAVSLFRTIRNFCRESIPGHLRGT
jgi:hypothetical protein